MTRKTTPVPADALARAQAETEAAATALARARADAKAVRAHELDQRERLASGDETVTALDLATAAADCERADLIVAARDKAHAAARATAAPIVAAHWSAAIEPVMAGRQLEAATLGAAEAIAAALSTLAEAARADQRLIEDAIRAARDAGLGRRHDLPVSLTSVAEEPALRVNGNLVRPVDVAGVVARAITDGAQAAGWRVDSQNASPVRVQVAPEPETWSKAEPNARFLGWDAFTEPASHPAEPASPADCAA